MALIVRIAMRAAVFLGRRRGRPRRKKPSMTIAIFLKFKLLFETLRLCSLYPCISFLSYPVPPVYFLINIYTEFRRGEGNTFFRGIQVIAMTAVAQSPDHYVCKFVCDRIYRCLSWPYPLLPSPGKSLQFCKSFDCCIINKGAHSLDITRPSEINFQEILTFVDSSERAAAQIRHRCV